MQYKEAIQSLIERLNAWDHIEEIPLGEAESLVKVEYLDRCGSGCCRWSTYVVELSSGEIIFSLP